MSYTMNREKNIVCFLADGKSNPYKLDVNTGVFYGLGGKPIKSCPTGFGGWIDSHRNDSNILFLLYSVRSNPSRFDTRAWTDCPSWLTCSRLPISWRASASPTATTTPRKT